MDDIVDTEGSGVSSPSAVTTDMVTTINTATATRALVELRRCGGDLALGLSKLGSTPKDRG